MKKTIVSLAILGLIFSNLPTFAVVSTTEKGHVMVNTTANTEIPPDTAEISFAIQTFDTKSMQTATLENKKTSEKVLTELKALINPVNGDFIKTSDFNATPIYTYINSKKTFEKYEVSNRILIHTKSIDKIGSMIDKAIQAGATNVSNLSFSASNYENHCNDLITIATQKAKSRADVVAKSLDSSIVGINSINVSCSTNTYNPPRLYMAKNMIADVAAESTALGGSTEISNGVIKINANVNASFFVK